VPWDPGLRVVFYARALTVFVVLATAVATIDISADGSSPDVVADSGVSPETPRFDRAPSFPKSAPAVDPDLKSATGRVNILVAIDESESYESAAALFEFARVLPSAGGTRILRGAIDASRLSDLESLPGVRSVLKDRPIAFPTTANRPDAPRPANRFQFPYQAETAFERDTLGSGPEVTMYDVVDFTGARRAWTDLGVDGAGVTIAIVDTGVDHGAMDLGEAAVARDFAGRPTSFDPDGGTYGRTTISVTSYTSGGRLFIRTLNTDPLIYVFDLGAAFGPYGPTDLSWSDARLFGAPFPQDMDITGLPASVSGVYHFGVLAEWHLILPFIYLDLFPVVVIDSAAPGVYNTVVLDLSFDWWLNGFQPSPDFSFSDEKVLRPSGGPFVASRDMDGDGYPDLSAGSLANGLDIWGVEPTVSEQSRVLPPLDADGDHVIFVYDWFGHGTSVAATAAGRETLHPFAGPGIAPGARIMGIPIFFWGDVIEGWLWAAGFDLLDEATPRPAPGATGVVYGVWSYSGNHRADVISNSWGASEWLTLPFFLSETWYDLVTVFEDVLMTPGYADPTYPGTLIVHAGGNGGAGYGTITEPSFSSLSLSVGASTSLDNTALPFGGFHHDVMSWSARGPNAFGAPKPDVVMVGAFAYTAASPWYGNGSGFAAYTLFGGTSQATPATAGSAAVAIEAFRVTRGRTPSPFEIKSILKSTADDLGYDAFVQGAGQVNVYNAAAFAQNLEGLLVTSPATWEAARSRVAAPWASAGVSYGYPVGGAPPTEAIVDTSWFAGVVRPGGTAASEFTLASPTSSGTTTLSAVSHQRIASLTRTGTTGNLGAGWLEGFGTLVPLQTTDLAPGSDLMLVRASISYLSFDPEFDQLWNNRIRIVVGDWVDGDGNGIVAPGEFRVFNYGYNAGTTVEARVGFPLNRFTGRPVLWLSQLPSAGRPFASIGFTIQVEFSARAPWSWISIPASAPTSGIAVATLTVPSNASPGVYEGQIVLRPAVGNGTVVPVSVVVPRVMDGTALSASLTGPASTAIYDSSLMSGYFDWRWRYEAGDWRLWFVQVDDPTVIALRIDASWQDRDTDVDLWSLTPGGIPRDSSFSPYLGEGNFRWDTRTGGPADWIIVHTSSGFARPGPGLYTVALHNVLFGSNPPPEPVAGGVKIAKLAPRGPVTRSARPADMVSTQFTLTTGFSLTNIFWDASPPPGGSAFPGSASPADIQNMLPGASITLSANFIVPEGTPDGEYLNYVVLAADQLFAFVRVDIVVDSLAPSLSVLSPAANAVVGGSVLIEATSEDAGGFGSVAFVAGTSPGSLSRDPGGSIWAGTWNSVGIPDGPIALRVTATDAAGNARSVDRNVVVDNTAPQVTITSPSGGATVSGAVPIVWQLVEANPGSVFLKIDDVLWDVTGNTSFSFDTNRFTDGAHTIEIHAVDRAGNTAVATATLTVDNLAATRTASLLTGLGIGSLIAAVIGFVLGIWFERRRRRRPPKVSPPPPVATWSPTPPPEPPPTPPEPIGPPGPP